MKLYSKIVISVLFIIPMILTISPVSTAMTCKAISICDMPNIQYFNNLCSDGEGGALITWSDNRSGLGYDIYAQKIDINGSIVWNPSGIAICTEVGHQDFSRICIDGEGGAIIVWRDQRNESDRDIYAQRINTDGILLWNASGVLVSTRGYSLQICSDNSGGAIIAWDHSADFYAQRVSSNGTIMWDTDGVVICNATDRQENLQFFCDDNGNSFFTWDDYRKGEISPFVKDSDIFAQKVDMNGIVQWQPNGTAICIADDYQFNPQICTDGEGGAIINWVDLRDVACYAQRINSTGDGQWGSNGSLLASSVGMFSYNTMHSDGEGGAIIAVRGFFSNLYALRINSSGNILYATLFYTTEDHYAGTVRISSDGEGGYFLTWSDGTPPPQTGPYTYDVLAQNIDANGKIFWSKTCKVICNAPGDQTNINICSNGLGKAFISWDDWDGYYNSDIYMFLLEKVKNEETILFGNFYLPLTILAVLALVIVSKRQLFKT